MITKALASLIASGDRFYAEIFMRLRKVADPECKSMAVSFDEGTLYYNPTLVETAWSVELTMEALKHEALHIIMDHIPRMGQITPLGNIAADLAVNSLLPKMPNSIPFMDDNGGVELGEICTVNNLNKKYPDLALKAAMNYEYYYEKLKTKAQELEQSGMDSQDDHDKMSGNESATSQAKARQLVREAMAASTRAGDKISGDVRSLVSKLLGDEATWEQELRRFPQDAEVFSVSKDRRHRNRRFGYVYPGDKKERRVKLAVGFDLSGSITDDIKDRFVTELRHIYNSGAELVVLFFDTTVTAVKDFADADFSWKVPGGGGTLFQPVIDKAAELRVDGLIFLTDGECFDTIEEPAFPVLWGLLEGFEHRQAFGRPITVSMK